ncbi:hypothetical protein IFR05_013296 [Cadophora sp. M221]|nr:hypothetical protein IFR05_013296 [Cadophora sp. M221]
MAATISQAEFKEALSRYPEILKSHRKTPKDASTTIEDLDKFRYQIAPMNFSKNTGWYYGTLRCREAGSMEDAAEAKKSSRPALPEGEKKSNAYIPSGKPRGRPAMSEAEKKAQKSRREAERTKAVESVTNRTRTGRVVKPRDLLVAQTSDPKKTRATKPNAEKPGRPAARVAPDAKPAKKRGRPAAKAEGTETKVKAAKAPATPPPRSSFRGIVRGPTVDMTTPPPPSRLMRTSASNNQSDTDTAPAGPSAKFSPPFASPARALAPNHLSGFHSTSTSRGSEENSRRVVVNGTRKASSKPRSRAPDRIPQPTQHEDDRTPNLED